MPSVSRYAWAVARRKCVWRIQASIPRRHVASISCAAIAAKWVAAITCTYNCCSVFCFVFFLLEINGIWKAYFHFQHHTEQKKREKYYFSNFMRRRTNKTICLFSAAKKEVGSRLQECRPWQGSRSLTEGGGIFYCHSKLATFSTLLVSQVG